MRKMLKGLQEGPHTRALVPPCLITGLMGTGCQPMMASLCPVQLRMTDLGLPILCFLLPRIGIIRVCQHSQFTLGMESRAQWMLG